MTPRRILVLLAVAVVVIGAALWMASRRDSAPATAGAKVLPALSGSLNEITEVRVVTAGGKNAATLTRDEKFWRVSERAGYPADSAKLRKLLIALSELETVEEKTANPDNYARLGVEDPAAPTATSVRIDLVGLDQPASLIVGKSAGGDSSFVRPGDNATSLQAKPMLSVEREPRNWLDRAIVDVASERVQQVRISAPAGKPYEITRENRQQADFTVPELPRGKKLSSPSAANHIAGALTGLTLDDVSRAGNEDAWSKDVARAEYRLFDGTTVTVTGRKDGEKNLVRVAIGFDEEQYQRFAETAPPAGSTGAALPANADAPGTPGSAATATTPDAASPQGTSPHAASPQATSPADAGTAAAVPGAKPPTLEDARAAAQAAGARVDGWVYEIPAYKYETLFQPLDDLLSN